MRPLFKISAVIGWAVAVATAMADPQYQIFDIGVIQVGDTASQGFGVSPGGVAVGRSVRSGGAQAFSWTQGGGLIALPNLAGRSFAVSNDANDSGVVVGTAANSLFGTSRLPVIWQSGVVSQLPLPAGETLGDANSVNALGVAVGSVDGGSTQQGVIYNGGSATVITQTTANNEFFVTAFGINNSGRIVGQGTNQAQTTTVGIVYDMGSPQAFIVGVLPGQNGGIAFAVSNAGHVVGSSTFNGGSGLPFIWSQANGTVAIPLAAGTSQGSARGVNSAGWVVGQDSSAFSIPFLWDGTTTYRLADLLPPGSGWDLSMNTSSSALGISDDGVIVGTGVHNGETHGYAMVPVAGTPTPTPTPTATPSPTPCGLIYRFRENFDGVTAPGLPAGWVTGFTPGAANCTPSGTCALGTKWATSTTNPDTAPNCVFHNAPGCVTDSILDTPSFVGGDNSTLLIFRHSYDLENGLDGAVLEISINGGPFVDFVAAGGGNVGYNGTIAAGSQNPIAGRAAWTGNSGGYVTTTAQMPFPSGTVRLRFRLATSCSGASTGWRIDSMSVVSNIGCQSPTPTPTATPSTTPNEPHFEVSAPLAVTQYFPFNITVTAKLFNNTWTNYTGTVHFTSTSSGNGTHLPADSTLTNGVGTFSVMLGTPGFQTVTARDTVNPSMIGESNPIFVHAKGSPTPSPSPTPTATASPTVTPTPTATPTPTPSLAPPTQALNLSTRMRVQTGDNAGIGGFIITGTAPKYVLLRGIGPSLAAFGITNVLANPTLDLRRPDGTRILANDNWRDTQEAEIMATGLPPTNNLEAAIVETLDPGSYTVILRGMGMTTGVGLVEVYDLNQGVSSKLANLSTRALVDTGDNIVIAGFTLGGNTGSSRIVVRGIGPSLTALGVSNALANPKLELRDSNGALLIANNDWQDNQAQAAELSAAGLAPTNQLESGIAITLPPSPYTALLAGVNNGTGVGVVEVYDRGPPP
ncbi:MAG: hypothetical protein QOC70_2748 [Verrucomicrobiota bacterium]|jgi:hypothetical protein